MKLDETRLGSTTLRMSDGSIREFNTPGDLERFERVAQAIKNNPEFKAKLAAKRRQRRRKRRIHEGLFGKKAPKEAYMAKKKTIEQRLKSFGITPGTEAERNKQAADELRKLKLQHGMAEDWKEGMKTFGKSFIPGYHSYRTFKNVRARGGSKKQAFGQIAKDVGKDVVTGGFHGVVQAGHRVGKDWQKGRRFPHPSMESEGDITMSTRMYEVEPLDEKLSPSERASVFATALLRKRGAKSIRKDLEREAKTTLPSFISPSTLKGQKTREGSIHRLKQIERAAKGRAWRALKGKGAKHMTFGAALRKDYPGYFEDINEQEEFAMECPYCEGVFEMNDVDLYEDNEGQFLICPFCDEDIDLVEGEEDEKEFTMTQETFEALLANVSQLTEDDIDGFVDNLTAEEIDQMIEFCDILAEMEAEEEAGPRDIAEGIIDSIVAGANPAEVANMIAGIEE